MRVILHGGLIVLLCLSMATMGLAAPPVGGVIEPVQVSLGFDDTPPSYPYLTLGQPGPVSATVTLSAAITPQPNDDAEAADFTVVIMRDDPVTGTYETEALFSFSPTTLSDSQSVSITLPDAAGAYTYYAVCEPCTPASATACVVEVDSLEYQLSGGTFAAVTSPLYVPTGEDVTFRAVPNPASAPTGWTPGTPVWPTDTPTWTGATASTTTVGEASDTYTTETTVTATCGDSSQSVTVTPVSVFSLLPNTGVEFDDGDNDSDTKAFLVARAATGDVTVTATPDPEIGETLLPSAWSFTGGTAVGSGKLQRTVSKTTPGLTTFTCLCGDSTKTVSIYIMGVDLQWGALSETTEVTPGAFLGLNDNDDNNNGIPDFEEDADAEGHVTVTNEANLVAVNLVIPDCPPIGNVTLSGDETVKVWTSATKGTALVLPATWNLSTASLPTTVYVEGVEASTSIRDSALTLNYAYTTLSLTDSVTMTVVKTAITGAASEGVVAIVNRDDDNVNDAPDLDDTGTVDDEDDLVPITLNLYPADVDAGSLGLALPTNLKGWTSSTKGTQVTSSWTLPINNTTFTPITVYLEGTAASLAVQDGIVKLTYTNSGNIVHASTVNSTVADLEISLSDNVILTNTDDDDTNNTSDLGQTGPITSENDLEQLRITLTPAGLTGTVSASARTIQFGDPDQNGHRPITGYGAKQVNVYMDAAKGTAPPAGMSWTLNGTTTAPDALWLEGATVSAITDDQEITVQFSTGDYTLSAITTATVNAHPETSEVTFKLYAQSPINQNKSVLNNEISGDVGGSVSVVMEVKLGPGEKLASSTATIRIKDTWSGYEDGQSRGWIDIPVDFTSSSWYEMVNQPNGNCDLTWTTVAPAGTDNANGTTYRSFYAVIKTWNTPAEPYAEYYQQATASWVHFANPTVGHNGNHDISVVAVDGDTAQTALEFQHYDANANPPGWQAAVAVDVAKRSVTVANLVVTSLSPGNGTIDYIKYDPDPEGKYHRPTMKATFTDTNPSGQQHTYVCYWMLLATASPKPREHLDMNDVYSRSDAVINSQVTPTSVDFTWHGTVGEVNTEDILAEDEYDVAEWGTYTYDVDVIEYDENDEIVDWHSYKWPSCLSIGEHTITATDNENGEGSTLNYTYVLHDIANEDTTGYYPNAEAPSDVQVVVIDNNLEEQTTIGLATTLDGQTRGGVAATSCVPAIYFDSWRTVYIGQDNCWTADRRDHIPSRMLAINKRDFSIKFGTIDVYTMTWNPPVTQEVINRAKEYGEGNIYAKYVLVCALLEGAYAFQPSAADDLRHYLHDPIADKESPPGESWTFDIRPVYQKAPTSKLYVRKIIWNAIQFSEINIKQDHNTGVLISTKLPIEYDNNVYEDYKNSLSKTRLYLNGSVTKQGEIYTMNINIDIDDKYSFKESEDGNAFGEDREFLYMEALGYATRFQQHGKHSFTLQWNRGKLNSDQLNNIIDNEFHIDFNYHKPIFNKNLFW